MSHAEAIEANIIACYPERAIAGFSRVDSTFLFYSYIKALVSADSTVLDLGAGRGAQGQTGLYEFKRDLPVFKGRVAKVVGADVDPAVLENPFVDEAVVFEPGGRLPFGDASFDVVFSDWVLEHIDDPVAFVAEVRRVLKPGGWFCARTPNKYGLIAVASSLIPNRLHAKVLKKLQPDRLVQDVFPTRYRLNTLSAIKKHFPPKAWRNCSFTHANEIMYLARSRAMLKLGAILNRFTPSAMLPVLFVFVQNTSRAE